MQVDQQPPVNSTSTTEIKSERGLTADGKLLNAVKKPRRNGKPQKGRAVEVRPEVLPFFPRGLDVAEHMRQAGWTEREIAGNRVWAEVYVATVCDERERRGAKPDEFAPVWSEHLLRYIPGKKVGDRTLLRRLRETFRSVIEHTDYTRPDAEKRIKGECRQYRLTVAYRGLPCVPVTVLSAELSARLQRPPQRWEQKQDRAECNLTELARGIRTRSEAFYLGEAKAVTGHPNPTALELTGERPRKFSVDDYGRVHTPVVRCPNELKPYLRVRGQEGKAVYAVDVKASQVGIVLLVATGRYSPKAEDVAGLLDPAADWPEEAGETEQQRVDWLCLKCSQIGANDGYEVLKAFTNPATDFDPYAYFAVLLNLGLPTPEYTRAGGKKQLIQLFFINPEAMEHTAGGKAFRGMFPKAFEALRFFSRHLRPKGMAHLAQRVESRIMIRMAAAQIIRERPELVFCTGHDAIYVAQGTGPDDERVVEYVKGVIMGSRDAELSIPTRLEVEAFAEKVKRPKAEGKRRKKKGESSSVKQWRQPTRAWLRAHGSDRRG